MAVEESIQDLVNRAQSGDREALEALLARFNERLETRVRSRMGEHLKQRVEVRDVLILARGKIIENSHLLSAFEQRFGYVGTDKTCASCY